ncbi:unnamed protein product [Paramecium sonneborni]|uniref:Uncharacterized protein n=1 Tax=Paramecium sonneborni TaxID=65129 RepID=A0A8S1RGC3_9CILI|nr:unnamed protein product [Paramecium sonneborni]
MACQLQLNKCRQKIDKPQEQQQGNKRKPNQNVLSCLKKNKNSYNLIDCAYQNCENNSKSELYQYLLGKN